MLIHNVGLKYTHIAGRSISRPKSSTCGTLTNRTCRLTRCYTQLLALAMLQHTDQQMGILWMYVWSLHFDDIGDRSEIEKTPEMDKVCKRRLQSVAGSFAECRSGPEASAARWLRGVAEMSPSSVTADPETMALRWSQRGVRDSQKVFSIRKECIILGGGWGVWKHQTGNDLGAWCFFSNQSGMKLIRASLIRYSFIYFIRQKHVLMDNLGKKKQTYKERGRGEGMY